MAGHSKWANIQHRKGAQDKKRAKIFTKIIREITVAARMGGSDLNSNPRLRLAVDKANANNMPKENVERAIKRGAGELEGQNYEEIRYEGYGPGGVAVMVDCMTDNRNRTVSDVRHAFSKCGGELGKDGSVAYMFEKKGIFNIAAGDEEHVMEVTLEAGAEDVVANEDGSIDVYTAAEEYEAVKQSLEGANIKLDSAELTMQASNQVNLDLDNAQKMIRLFDMLEELDDVQEVYSNADISQEILDQLGS